MFKRIVSMLAAFILLFQVPLAGSSVALAQESSLVSFPFFTGVELIDLDTGQTLGDPSVVDVDKDAHVKIAYSFEIPDDVSVAEGDTYRFAIPDQIDLGGGISGCTLQDGEGTVVAHVDVTDGGEGTVTFTDAASHLRDVGGVFEIQARLDPDDIDNTEIVGIPFTLGTDVKTIDVRFQQPDAVNAKAGTYDAATGAVTWTITLNSNETTVDGATLIDAITPGGDLGQTYLAGTFKVAGADGRPIFDSSASAGGQGSGTFGYEPVTGDPSMTGTLSYAFADSFEESITVTYKTVLADPSHYFGRNVSNEAVFDHDGIQQNIAATVSVPEPDYIAKTGAYNEETGKIDWGVEFNKEGLPLHGVEVSDTLPAGLILDGSSVKLDGTPVSSGSGGAVGTFAYTRDTGLLVYHAGDIDSSHVLTFSTSLPDDYWQQNHAAGEYSNTATMTSSDNAYLENGASSGTSGVGPGNSVIRKSSLGYDSNTHRITWQIVVNGSQQRLPDAVVADTIPAGQRYLTDTFAITAGAGVDIPVNEITGAYSFAGTLPEDPSANPTILTYRFGDITSSYTITFQTEVTDPAVWAGNTSALYRNRVTLDPGGDIPASSGGASQRVDEDIVGKSASYDYVTHRLTWSIVVNRSQVPLTGVMVTDVLAGGGLDDFALDPSSIRIDGNLVDESSAMPPALGASHYDEDTKTLTVNVGDLKSDTASERTKVVTFDMTLDKEGEDYSGYFSENGDKTIENAAVVSSQENPSTEAKATQVIHNRLIDKAGYYTSGKAYIDWAVQVNQNQITLTDLKLTDTLQEGLELDTSSIKLYRQVLQPNGSLTPSPSYDQSTGELSVAGESVPLSADNVSYDAQTRKFVFTMPEGVGDGQPCLLVFRTTIDASHASGTSFSNSVEMSGSEYFETGDSGGQQVSFATMGGTAWGTTGDIALSKEDAATGSPLSGTVFGLYDVYGNLVRISDATETDGRTSFDHINFNTRYTVRELSAPENYEVGDGSFTFELDRGSGDVQRYDNLGNPIGDPESPQTPLPFANDRKVGTITFQKTGDDDEPLMGAEFTLCDQEGTPLGGFAPQTSGDDGRVTFQNVPYGTYLARETGAPVGYRPITITVSLLDSNPAVVTDGEGVHTLDLGVRRDDAVGSLTLTKYRADYEGASATVMPGVAFEVLDDHGTVVREARETDDGGRIVFGDLEPGTYTLHEARTPSDYLPAEDCVFTIDAASPPPERQLTHEITNVKRAGSITLVKVDAVDGYTPLVGAVFTLYDASGENVVSNAEGPLTAVSDADGLVTFENVPYGDYVVKETSNPNNYGGTVAVEVSLHAALRALGTVDNTRSVGSIRFVKTDGNAPLAGATFMLSGNGIEPRYATSQDDGTVEFSGVPYRDTPYTVSETAAPAGYYQRVDDFEVTISDATVDTQGAVALSDPVVDVPLGSIALTKTDADGTALLPHAVFELLDAEGAVIQTRETNDEGGLSFDDLVLAPTGDTVFTVHEVTAPTDYALAPDRQVTLSHESATRDAEITVRDSLKTGTISLMKVTQDGDALAGATFTLYDALTSLPVMIEGTAVTAVSDDDGLVSFTDIPYGSYQIRETEAPDDYLGSDVVLEADLSDANVAVVGGLLRITTPVVNSVKTADIELTKRNEDGDALAGATFTLYDALGTREILVDGEKAVVESDENGMARLSGIPYGDYMLAETDPPVGYEAIEPLSVSLHDGNAELTRGVLNVGTVVDPRTPVSASVLSKTGDVLSVGLAGLVALLAVGSFALALSLRRLRRR